MMLPTKWLVVALAVLPLASCTPQVGGDAGGEAEPPTGGNMPPSSGMRKDHPSTSMGPGASADSAVPTDAPEATRSDAGATAPRLGNGASANPEAGAARDVGAADGLATTAGTETTDLTFIPVRRTFTDTMEVTLRARDPNAKIYYSLDDKVPSTASLLYAGPIKLAKSAIIRAFASSTTSGDGPVYDQGFVKLQADAASFSSDIPVFLVWSDRPRPQAKTDGIKPAVLLVFEPDATTGRVSLLAVPTVNTRIGINVRGSSSEGLPKKQYKIDTWGGGTDTGHDVSLLGLPADSDWIVNAGYSLDRAYVRNAFVYAVSNRIGRYAPRTKFAEMFFTASSGDTSFATDYVGLYTLIEKIKVGKNRVAIAKLRATDIAEPAVTGGYIFAIDRGNIGETGFTAGAGPNNVWRQNCPNGKGVCGVMEPLVFADPGEKRLVAQQKAYLPKPVNDFANALANKQGYANFIDVGSFIDHHIINVLPKNPDGLRVSAYFFLDRGGKINAGPAWDFDRTMGCAGDPRTDNPTFWDATTMTNSATNYWEYGWYRGLFDDPTFKAAYIQRWRDLLGTELSTAKLTALVDELVRQLGKEAPARDAKKWPGVAPRGGSFANEVTLLKDWITRRVNWIAGCLQLPDPKTCPGQ